ncbi:MAG: DUF3298 and DUF4163 domain-containing protein [Aureispira sp.]|nr:DUF3298 and DUF4163 domain-containing protein [Aureispira sp.]
MGQWGFIGTIILSITMLVACTETIDTGDQIEVKENVSTKDTLPRQIVAGVDTVYYTIQLVYKLDGKSKDYTQNDLTKIVFTFPQVDSFSQTNIKDSINHIVQNLLLQNVVGELRYENVEGRMLEFLEEYKEHKTEMLEFQLPSMNWVFEMDIDVLLNRPSLLSLRVNQLEFTGGAHANSWTNYLTIDLETGKTLSLENLFVADFEEELLTISEAAFKRTVNLALDTNLVETHYEFSSGEFMLPPHFSVGVEGLHFYYNPYDLGPFALGAISFDIPYREILSIIDTNVLLLEPMEG